MSTPSSGTAAQAAEEAIIAILADLLFLQPQEIERDRSFFETGVDSILAVEFVTTLRTRFGDGIALETLYDHPTPAKLAAALADEPSQVG